MRNLAVFNIVKDWDMKNMFNNEILSFISPLELIRHFEINVDSYPTPWTL